MIDGTDRKISLFGGRISVEFGPKPIFGKIPYYKEQSIVNKMMYNIGIAIANIEPLLIPSTADRPVFGLAVALVPRKLRAERARQFLEATRKNLSEIGL